MYSVMYGDGGPSLAAADDDGDVMAGDNARLVRPLDEVGLWSVDPNVDDVVRAVVLFDVEIAGDPPLDQPWRAAARALRDTRSSVEDSLAWLQRLHDIDPPQRCYQGRLNPEAAWAARERRLARDKAQLRESLRVIAKEIAESRIEQPAPAGTTG